MYVYVGPYLFLRVLIAVCVIVVISVQILIFIHVFLWEAMGTPWGRQSCREQICLQTWPSYLPFVPCLHHCTASTLPSSGASAGNIRSHKHDLVEFLSGATELMTRGPSKSSRVRARDIVSQRAAVQFSISIFYALCASNPS